MNMYTMSNVEESGNVSPQTLMFQDLLYGTLDNNIVSDIFTRNMNMSTKAKRLKMIFFY